MGKNHLMSPVIVNEHMYVIDGQHRIAAAMELKLPVYYIIADGYGIEEMQTLNQNTKNWTGTDFMNCYADLGHADYVILRDFMAKYKFGLQECVVLLGANRGSTGYAQVASGVFQVTQLAKAEEVALSILECGQFYEGYRRRSFVFALLALMERPIFVFQEFLDKLRNQRAKMFHCATTEQYIELIEEIYNYRRQNKINLRF
jgi:hypothetical protein